LVVSSPFCLPRYSQPEQLQQASQRLQSYAGVTGHVLRQNLQPHTYLFNSPSSGTIQVSWYQKGKTNLDFTEANDSEWQWHQLGHMQVCTSLQTDNHASTPPLSFFTGQKPFKLPTNSV